MNVYSEIVLFAIVLGVNLLLSGAVLAGGLALAFRFIEHASPQLRYYVSMAVFLLAILLPITVTLKTSSSRELLSSVNSQNSHNYERNSINSIGSSNAAPEENTGIASPAATENNSLGMLDKFISIAAGSLCGQVFFGFWISGIAWLLFREWLGVWRLRQARRLWEPATEAERQALLCPANIPLYFDEQQSPGTAGFLHPAIVLPKQFSAGLTLEAEVFILSHELAHAQRRDPLVSFILRLLRALFWISPALWLLERLIHAEREAAADRAAIGFSPSEPGFEASALNYADTLLTVAKEFSSFTHRRREAPMIGIGAGSELEIRIRRLLVSSRTTRLHVASALAACALSLIIIVIVPGAGFSEQSQILQSEFAIAPGDLKTIRAGENMGDLQASNQPPELPPLPARASRRNTPGQTARTVGINPGEESASIENSAPLEIEKNVVEARRKRADYQADKAAGDSKRAAELFSSSNADAKFADDKFNGDQPARPLQNSEITTAIEKPLNGPARKTELRVYSSPETPGNNLYQGNEPARQKLPGEYQFKSVNNGMPATRPE